MAENEQISEYEDEEPPKGIFRWMSSLVVVAAIAGFLALAWYAYKSGGDNVDEKDIELIKADKTPVKETPANPGGMEIPHQDKTVYGLISGEHTDKQNVERVLPAPEEPLAHNNETETWMDDKIKNKAAAPDTDGKPVDPATSEAIATAVVGDQKTPAPDATPPAADTHKAEQFNPAKAVAKTPAPAAPATQAAQPEAIAIAPAPVDKKQAVTAADVPSPKEVMEDKDANDQTASEKTVAPEPATSTPAASAPAKAKTDDTAATPAATVTAKPAPAKAATPVAATAAPALPKGTLVQLGAYKSEKEAQTDWGRISRAFPDELSKRQHYVVKVNLSKGTFYRLQAGPFANTEEGEQFCLGLVSAGQGCLIAHDK